MQKEKGLTGGRQLSIADLALIQGFRDIANHWRLLGYDVRLYNRIPDRTVGVKDCNLIPDGTILGKVRDDGNQENWWMVAKAHGIELLVTIAYRLGKGEQHTGDIIEQQGSPVYVRGDSGWSKPAALSDHAWRYLEKCRPK